MKDYLIRRIIKSIDKETSHRCKFVYEEGTNKVIINHGGVSYFYSGWKFILNNLAYVI